MLKLCSWQLIFKNACTTFPHKYVHICLYFAYLSGIQKRFSLFSFSFHFHFNIHRLLFSVPCTHFKRAINSTLVYATVASTVFPQFPEKCITTAWWKIKPWVTINAYMYAYVCMYLTSKNSEYIITIDCGAQTEKDL